MCGHSSRPVFVLRGACHQSYADRYYVLVYAKGKTFFAGLKGTSISFDKDSMIWEIKGRNFETLATSVNTFSSLSLGTNSWNISHENPDCERKDGQRMLTLSTCGDEEFTCQDGSCVGMDIRCDGKVDCPFDESDELKCDHVIIPNTYQNSKMAPPLERLGRTVIKLNVKIIEVLTIDEISSVFEVKFSLSSEWIDSRLTYLNLKNDENINTIEDRESIWTPKYLLGKN